MTKVFSKAALLFVLFVGYSSAYVIWITVYTSSQSSGDECKNVYPYEVSTNQTTPSGKYTYYIEADGAQSNKSLSDGKALPKEGVLATRNYEAFAESNAITNEEMKIYDTFYNGSYTMTLTPPTTKSGCPKITSQTMTSQFLQLGPKTRDKASREKYDKNPYYFRFGTTVNETSGSCPIASNKAFLGFTSSNDNLKYTQPWALVPAEKKGDAFFLKGSLTQVQASIGNYFFYTVNTTGADSSYPATGCPAQFTQHALTATDTVSMTTDVDREKATMNFQFVDAITGYSVEGKFSGTAWTQGARLSTANAEIVTEGQGAGSRPDSVLTRDAVSMMKYVIGGVVGGIVLLILLCVGCCCCCAAKKKRGEKVEHGTPGYS